MCARGGDCVSYWGRTFIQDDCTLAPVVCNRTLSSCGKYVPDRNRRSVVQALAPGSCAEPTLPEPLELGQIGPTVSKSAAKAPAGLVSMGKNRMISRFPSTGELNLDSFAADLDTGGSPGVRSVSGAAGGGGLLKVRAPLRRPAGSGVTPQ